MKCKFIKIYYGLLLFLAISCCSIDNEFKHEFIIENGSSQLIEIVLTRTDTSKKNIILVLKSNEKEPVFIRAPYNKPSYFFEEIKVLDENKNTLKIFFNIEVDSIFEEGEQGIYSYKYIP